jgi:hypothetical protein
MIDATQYRKAATGLISFVAVGLLLGRNVCFYRLEEILICWLFFSLAFASLALVISAGIFVFYASEYVVHFVRTALRVISTLELRPSEIYAGTIPAEDRSEPAKELLTLTPDRPPG